MFLISPPTKSANRSANVDIPLSSMAGSFEDDASDDSFEELTREHKVQNQQFKAAARRRSSSQIASTTVKLSTVQACCDRAKMGEKQAELMSNATSIENLYPQVVGTREVAIHTFDIVYQYDTALGLGLGRITQPSASGAKQEQVAVITVFPTRASAIRGVQAGDVIVAVNDRSLEGKSFDFVLARIRTTVRPLKLTFERRDDNVSGFTADEFLIKRDWLTQPPKHLSSWKSCYIGYGIFRNPYQLQVYDSILDYETAMERIYRGQSLKMGSKMHAHVICAESDVGELYEQAYGDEVITFFNLKPTNGICKLVKIGSSNHQAVVALYNALRNSIQTLKGRASTYHLYSS